MSDIDYKAIIGWSLSSETGSSSKFMASYLLRIPTNNFCSYPHDSGDFSRCIALLTAAPSLRLLLPKMAEASPYWKSLIEHWDEIEKSDEQKQCALIKLITGKVRETDSNSFNFGKNATISFGGYKSKPSKTP